MQCAFGWDGGKAFWGEMEAMSWDVLSFNDIFMESRLGPWKQIGSMESLDGQCGT